MRRSERVFSIVIIHVDDSMLFAWVQDHIEAIKSTLKSEFCIKELGPLEYCLGIEVRPDAVNKTIRIDQRAYIKQLAKKMASTNARRYTKKRTRARS